MRSSLPILLLAFLLCVAGGLSAQQQLMPSAQQASKLTQQDVPELTRKAEAGNAKAQLFLSHAYKYAYGISKEESEAVKWYRAEADQGNAASAQLPAVNVKIRAALVTADLKVQPVPKLSLELRTVGAKPIQVATSFERRKK
jgi:hypothetical protein